MKQWKWFFGLGVILLTVCVWAEEFKFVSILSGPVASFGELETKACAVTQPSGEFNAGSEESSGGTITIYGAPIQVGSVLMEHDTKITTKDTPISWLVNTLQVGSSGSVEVQKLIANSMTLNNNDKEASLSAESLIINEKTWTDKGKATSSLQVKHENSTTGNWDAWFSFSSDSEPTKNATWKQVASSSLETVDGNNDPTVYYPITTAN